MADAAMKQRINHGAQHPFAKLVESDVLTIRADFMAGKRMSELARTFAVDDVTILDIVTDKAWRSVRLTSSFPRSNALLNPGLLKGTRMKWRKHQIVEILNTPPPVNKNSLARTFGVSRSAICKVFNQPQYYLQYAKP